MTRRARTRRRARLDRAGEACPGRRALPWKMRTTPSPAATATLGPPTATDPPRRTPSTQRSTRSPSEACTGPLPRRGHTTRVVGKRFADSFVAESSPGAVSRRSRCVLVVLGAHTATHVCDVDPHVRILGPALTNPKTRLLFAAPRQLAVLGVKLGAIVVRVSGAHGPHLEVSRSAVTNAVPVASNDTARRWPDASCAKSASPARSSPVPERDVARRCPLRASEPWRRRSGRRRRTRRRTCAPEARRARGRIRRSRRRRRLMAALASRDEGSDDCFVTLLVPENVTHANGLPPPDAPANPNPKPPRVVALGRIARVSFTPELRAALGGTEPARRARASRRPRPLPRMRDVAGRRGAREPPPRHWDMPMTRASSMSRPLSAAADVAARRDEVVVLRLTGAATIASTGIGTMCVRWRRGGRWRGWNLRTSAGRPRVERR